MGALRKEHHGGCSGRNVNLATFLLTMSMFLAVYYVRDEPALIEANLTYDHEIPLDLATMEVNVSFGRRLTNRGTMVTVEYAQDEPAIRPLKNMVFRMACGVDIGMFENFEDVSSVIDSKCPDVRFRHMRGVILTPPRRVRYVDHYFTVIRKPWKRAAAGFATKDRCRRSLNALNVTILAFEYFDCITACISRVIAGYPCGKGNGDDTLQVGNHFERNSREGDLDDSEILQKALGRLPHLDFVGIEEEWDATVRYFSLKFGLPYIKEREIVTPRQPIVPTWLLDFYRHKSFVDDRIYARARSFMFQQMDMLPQETPAIH